MPFFDVEYTESGNYKASQTLVVEADTQEDAIKKAKSIAMKELEYDYEKMDSEYY